MAKIGSWWLAKHKALDGELVEFSVLANRTQSSNRAVGGKLFVTNKRVLFSPHLIDYLLKGELFALNLADIVRIDRQGAGGDTFGGGLRARLLIETRSGPELFVVNKLDSVIQKLHDLSGK
jgi:hypothetical protein